MRPSARRSPDQKPKPAVHREPEHRVRCAPLTRRELEERILEALAARHPQWFYVVEVGQMVGVAIGNVYAGSGRVKGRLVALEEAGFLESEHRPSPGSGLGRRYFRARLSYVRGRQDLLEIRRRQAVEDALRDARRGAA